MLPALETVTIIETDVSGSCVLGACECAADIIIFRKGMESEERTLRNLAEFKKRLYDKWPIGKRKPVIHPPDGRRLRHKLQRGDIQQVDLSSGPWQDRTVDPHRWMECMKRFSEEFRQITALQSKKQKHGHFSSHRPVVVALIDDGKRFLAPINCTNYLKVFHLFRDRYFPSGLELPEGARRL